MSLHSVQCFPDVFSITHLCSRSRWLPVLFLSLRTFQRLKYGCSASQSAISRLEMSSCFPCLKAFILVALLPPFSRRSAQLCSSCDIVGGAEMQEVPVSHVILSLWDVVWGWPKVLLSVAGGLQGLSPAHCSAEHEEAALARSSALCFSVCFHPTRPCLLSPCTTPPSAKERWGSPKSDSLWEQQHLLPASALAMCALCLCHPWVPREGCSPSSLRLVQEQGCIKDLGLLRWPASDFHF